MDHERGREFRKKKYAAKEKDDKQMRILQKVKDNSKSEDNPPQTILLKTRDEEKRAISPQAPIAKSGKDGEPVYLLAPKAPDLSLLVPNVPEMKTCVKLINPETLALSEAVMEYLTDSTDFLVIGCLGYQGVGKSSIMSRIANPESSSPIFPVANSRSLSTSCSEGIDIFVTRDRIILLDVEPLLSSSFLNRRGDEDAENEVEMLSLQYAALLMSVCHILIVVQDSMFDTDLLRFLQAAEMLKPGSQSQSEEDPSLDYFPYMVFLHNKVRANLFTYHKVKAIQDFYKLGLAGSQLPVSSGIGVASGTILRSLNPELCGEPLNLFLLPHYSVSKIKNGFYWNIQFNELMKKMTMQLLSLPPVPLSHPMLTEKNWWHYIHKIWEDIKKSTFFPEYGRLLPTQATAKAELGNT